MTTPEQTNPYAAGNAADNAANNVVVVRRSLIGWPLIPAVLVGISGVLGFLGNVAILVVKVLGDPYIVPFKFLFWEYELRFVAMLAGIILIVAAVNLAHRRWKSALVFIILAVIVAAANPPTNRMLRHHFAGDGYIAEPFAE